MRRRLLAVLVGFALLVVAVLAVPLMLASADGRTGELSAERSQELQSLAGVAARTVQDGRNDELQEVLDRYVEVYGEPVLVVNTRQQLVASAGAISVTDPAIVSLTRRALINQSEPGIERLEPWSTRPVLLAQPLGQGTSVKGAVVMRVDVRRAAADIGRAWWWVAAAAVICALGALLLTSGVTRWVLRPLHRLEAGVSTLTGGAHGTHVGLSGPPELKRLAREFNVMSDAVAESVQRQRRLVADTSHQLRNPLAALRLRIDTLDTHVDKGGRTTYGAAAGELGRLEGLLDQMLELARAEEMSVHQAVPSWQREARPDEAWLDGVVAERLDYWRPSAAGQQQRLRDLTTSTGIVVAMTVRDLAQLVDIAVDNALRHAGVGANIDVSAGIAVSGQVELRVTDNGPGLSPEELELATRRFWRSPTATAPGSGLGLAIAHELAVGHGGSLRLHAADPTGLMVTYLLPQAGTKAS